MSEASNNYENKIADHIGDNTQDTKTTNYMALFTTAPTDSTAGTEVSGNGYSRQAVSFGAASGGVVASDAAVTFTASGGSWGTVVAAALMDASSGGNIKMFTPVTNQAVADGGTLNFAIGQITVAVD